MPVRPSLLPLARHCGHSVKLAMEYPEGSIAATNGTRIHAEFEHYIRTGEGSPKVAAAIACLPAHTKIESEVPLFLWDPDGVCGPDPTCDHCVPIITIDRSEFIDSYNDGNVDLLCPQHAPVSMGHTDIILTHEDGSLSVIDIKTGVPDKVDPADENLQLLCYGLAAAFERGAKRFRAGLYYTEYPPLRLSRWFADV